MFDRFGVGAPSPFSVHGGILVIAAHVALIAYGLRTTTRREDPPDPVVVAPLALFHQPERRGATGSAPVIPAPGPIDVSTSIPPVVPVTISGGPIEPWPIVRTDSIGSPAAPDLGGVYDPSIVEQQPELLSSPPPRYPEMLRLAHVEGVVIVQAVVDTLGHVERSTLKVISSPHPALSASALECLSGAVFRPGRVEGRAVRVLVQVPVQFTISGR
ncbi:MAG TPA: TonB family protein [Gemmatimonadales bacterium]|nr:TonB family protein [Gemmatimonadales bacterium]